MNWNGFPSIFQKVQYIHFRHLKTTSHLLRICLKSILKSNEVWPLEGAIYISLWENYRGHPDNVSFMQFCTKIDGFQQKYSQGFENSYNSYERYPLEKFFIFTIYQNYTLALIRTSKVYFNQRGDKCDEIARGKFSKITETACLSG